MKLLESRPPEPTRRLASGGGVGNVQPTAPQPDPGPVDGVISYGPIRGPW